MSIALQVLQPIAFGVPSNLTLHLNPIGLFFMFIGLFVMYIGLFVMYMGLFCMSIALKVLQPIAFGVSSNLTLHSQSHGSLFNETRQKRPKERDEEMKFETTEVHSLWHDTRNDTRN